MHFELTPVEALWEVLPRVSDSIRLIIPRRSPSLKVTTHMQAMRSCIFDVICASRLSSHLSVIAASLRASYAGRLFSPSALGAVFRTVRSRLSRLQIRQACKQERGQRRAPGKRRKGGPLTSRKPATATGLSEARKGSGEESRLSERSRYRLPCWVISDCSCLGAMRYGYLDSDNGARAVGIDLHAAAQLQDPLAHTPEPNAERSRRFQLISPFWRYALASVRHFNLN
jgi:hypothetical protein